MHREDPVRAQGERSCLHAEERGLGKPALPIPRSQTSSLQTARNPLSGLKLWSLWGFVLAALADQKGTCFREPGPCSEERVHVTMCRARTPQPRMLAASLNT